MKVEAKIPLAALCVERNSEALKKAFLDVLHQLCAAMISLTAEIAALSSVVDEMTITLVIRETVQSKLEFNCHLLMRNVKRQIKRLKMGHVNVRSPTRISFHRM
ncbi:hypothetical protein A584_24282 [Pseudomonas syringae pv. theae ICMP 3923]|nr:hypothetical protein A584_24282 [Pseudomonas syringae pv. theae ICMP 3923]GKQ32372.1 hypothetical protein PSTH68_22655 [Pseudomonas syringae pv. theae]